MNRAFRTLPLMLLVLAQACGDDDDGDAPTTADFTVRIENIGPTPRALSAGVFNIPVGATDPGALVNTGDAYEFQVTASPGDRLSFVSMFVPSNDYLIATGENGVELFLEPTGQPLNGSITNQLTIWDAGTEEDQPLGEGDNQANPGGAVGQPAPNIGPSDDDPTVRLADAANLPAVSQIVAVTVTTTQTMAGQVTTFTVRIENVSDDSTLNLMGGGNRNVIVTPGVWAVHAPNQDAPFFAVGEADRGLGLESLAEDGNPAPLEITTSSALGPVVPLSPGAFVVFDGDDPLGMIGDTASAGLEDVAEDGMNTVLASEFAAAAGTQTSGTFMMPVGSMAAGPIGPGQSYEFSFRATAAASLTFASMYIQSNDAYLAPAVGGISLFQADGPVSGDVTSQIRLYDAGTEVNEASGLGPNQAPRSAVDTGMAESGAIQLLSDVNDGFTYQTVMETLRVTITSTAS